MFVNILVNLDSFFCFWRCSLTGCLSIHTFLGLQGNRYTPDILGLLFNQSPAQGSHAPAQFVQPRTPSRCRVEHWASVLTHQFPVERYSRILTVSYLWLSWLAHPGFDFVRCEQRISHISRRGIVLQRPERC